MASVFAFSILEHQSRLGDDCGSWQDRHLDSGRETVTDTALLAKYIVPWRRRKEQQSLILGTSLNIQPRASEIATVLRAEPA